MYEGRILAIIGAVLILIAFIMPWVRLPLLGSLSYLDMHMIGVSKQLGEEAEEAIITTLVLSDSSIALGSLLYYLSLIGAIIVLRITGLPSRITPSTGVASASAGLLWITSIESRRVTIIGRMLIGVEYGPYVAMIAGCLVVVGYIIESHLRKQAQPK